MNLNFIRNLLDNRYFLAFVMLAAVMAGYLILAFQADIAHVTQSVSLFGVISLAHVLLWTGLIGLVISAVLLLTQEWSRFFRVFIASNALLLCSTAPVSL